MQLAKFIIFFLVVFACKQHTLPVYVSKYLLKWSKISLLLYRLLVSLWVGVAWANYLQQNLTGQISTQGQQYRTLWKQTNNNYCALSLLRSRSAEISNREEKCDVRLPWRQDYWISTIFCERDGYLHLQTTKGKYGLLFCSWVQSCSGTAHMSIFFIEIQKFCYHGNMKKQLLLSIIMPAAVWSSTISFLSLGVCSTYRKQLS